MSDNIFPAVLYALYDQRYLKQDGSKALAGDLVPDTDNARKLGSAILAFAEAYIKALNSDATTKNLIPLTDQTYALGTAIKQFADGFFKQITLGGVTRTSWPSAGSGSQSMDNVYDNGSVVSVDNTDVSYKVTTGKHFKITDSTGATVYFDIDGAGNVTFPFAAAIQTQSKADDAILANPRAQAQGLQTIAAASPSIQALDNANLNMGTNDFTISWTGCVPNWVPSGNFYILQKSGGAGPYSGLYLRLESTGRLNLALFRNDTGSFYTSSVATGLTNGASANITVVVTREAASQTGSVTYYVNGQQLGNSLAIGAATPVSISYASPLMIIGDNSNRYAGVVNSFIMFNRALTASDVLALYRNGVDQSDKWGSQTAKYTSDFSAGVDSWAGGGGTVAGNIDAIGGENDWLRFTCDAANSVHNAYRASASMVAGKRYRISLKYYLPSSNSNMTGLSIWSGTGGVQIGTTQTTKDAATIFTTEFTATSDGIRVYGNAGSTFQDPGGDDVFYVKSVVITEIGATFDLEPEGIQPNPGQWLDSSSNSVHAMQPASGSEPIRRLKAFEIRWTNSWSGTHEAQYIGGVNQAVLPYKAYIASAVITVAGATTQHIIIGDGSDDDRFLASFSLTNGTYELSLTNRMSDGINNKLVIDPDANFTGYIQFTIRGIMLD